MCLKCNLNMAMLNELTENMIFFVTMSLSFEEHTKSIRSI